ncbi:helix-turn-helix domain-containing protein [Pontibacterium sp. N1Y112]|uniref:Helix-turn-helix domain-containing protein n=1 Tax=Pontibacterium sinense TaxID=2781979 RepID=A0A8J7K7F1_9GAMM|nr:helix-turn-helix domain-containing protein [Pontibacterium sinense]MBE9398141.1 helix-turn-helix domain-containing protein [Pontibacterium sinense]
MEKSVLLWIDMKASRSEEGVSILFEKYFVVRMIGADQAAMLTPSDITPSAICFDYDFPDKYGLDLLRSTRMNFPTLPVLLLTEQHSEALAIWALRMRVWDFLVKPLNAAQTEQEIHQLKNQIDTHEHWETTPFNGSNVPPIPEEARFINNGTQEERSLAPAVSYIQQHLTEKISEEQMACLCRMRPFQFSRSFRKICGITFQEFVQRTRIEEAMRLLQNPNMTVLDIALSVGFRDQSYFTRVFKKHIGMAPTAYRDSRIIGETIHSSEHETLDMFGTH